MRGFQPGVSRAVRSNALLTPGRIFPSHPPDNLVQVVREAWPSSSSRLPKGPESDPVPFHECRGFYYDQRVAPVEEPSETHKIQSHRVSCSPGPHSALLVERELLPKMRFSAISAVRAKNNNRIWGEQSLQFTKGLRSFGRTLFSLGKRGRFSDVQ